MFYADVAIFSGSLDIPRRIVLAANVALSSDFLDIASEYHCQKYLSFYITAHKGVFAS